MYDFYFGIDPGKKGAIAWMNAVNNRVDCAPMPLSGSEIDVLKLHVMLTCPSNFSPVVWMEKVHAMPGNGSVSLFNFGYGVGILHGIIRTLGIPLMLVAPQTWKSVILRDTDKSKQAAIDYCKRTFPNVNLKLTARSIRDDDGLADALCIAEYGRRVDCGGV
jgi:crossover junction endodeoxyribonuclease RuvC